jgi:hypothetical protein
MRKFLATAVIAGSLVVGVGCTPGQGSRITEDDPRWDCNTMGNRICGPVFVTQHDHTLHATNRDVNYAILEGVDFDTVCVYASSGEALACTDDVRP